MNSTNIVKTKKTTILQKPSGTIAISGNLDARERKLYNMLLKVAEISLKRNPQQNIFTTTLATLKQALNVNEDDKNNATYEKILKRLKGTELEYNILEKDRHIKGFASLLDNVEIETDKITKFVTVTYSIPERVRQSMINKNGMYANIDLIIIRGLESKYSIILYELVKDYQKVEIPQMTIKEFRKLFGVDDKYHQMPLLRKWVLDVAIRELNDNENIDFLVDYKLIKTGKVYTHIKFSVKPKPIKLKELPQQSEKLEKQASENEDLKEILILIPKKYRDTQKVVSIVLGGLNSKSKEYTIAQVKYCVKQLEKEKVKNFIAYLKKAIEEDYAGFEKINLDIITVEDAIGYDGYITPEGSETLHIEIAEIKKSVNDGYLVRLDYVDTKKTYTWIKVDEKWLIERAKKRRELLK